MPSHRKEPPRPWQFWRGAFWSRPAVILLGGILLGLAGVGSLATVPGEVVTAGEIARARPCGAGEHTDCLLRRRVEVYGPDGKFRSWTCYVPGSEQELDEVRFPGWQDRKLDSGEVVDALLWNGEVVAVRTRSGDRLQTDGYGASRWLATLGFALMSVSFAVLAVRGARGRRSTLGGWWVTSSESSALPGPAWLNLATVPPIVIGVVLAFMTAPAQPWWFLTVAGGLLVFGLLALLPSGRRRRGRRVSPPPGQPRAGQ